MSVGPGTTLNGRYLLQKKLGSGGMAVVYLASDQQLQRPVAIKLLHQEIATNKSQLRRFKQEARAVAKLSHPNIVAVIDSGEDHSRPYIVFEYIQGQTLKQLIQQQGPLEITDAIAYAIEIARALSYAHRQGVIHRDIKPQNVLITAEHGAKVSDFGIAQLIGETGNTDPEKPLGTTDYIAPEQVLGANGSEQTDIYSLGIVLYEMLTGELPYTAENQLAIAMQHVQKPLPDIKQQRPEITAALAAVVEHCTAKQPKDRYSDADQLEQELEASLTLEASRSGHLTREATSVLPTLPAATRKRLPLLTRSSRRVTVLVGLLLVLLMVGVGLLLIDRTERGTGGTTKSPAGLKRVSLGQKAASDFDPLGSDGEHSEETVFALDRDPNTSWSTERYSGALNKAGVGMIIDAKPKVAARALKITTVTPGFKVEIHASKDRKPKTAPPTGWIKLTRGQRVNDTTVEIPLDTAGQQLRYYLIWITQLPKDGQAKLTELYLFK